jgi:hypothetical protein
LAPSTREGDSREAESEVDIPNPAAAAVVVLINDLRVGMGRELVVSG